MTTRNNSWLYLLTGIIITANIVTLAMLWIHRGGHDNRHDGPPQQGGMFEYLSKELHFTAQQQGAYSALRDEHHKATQQLQDSIRSAKDALFILLGKDSVSDDAVSQQSNRAAALSAQLDLLTFRHFQKVRALCNPDQQKQFDNIIQDALRTMAPQGRPGGGPPR